MIFLGVGSNMGDKQRNISLAYNHLENKGVNILRKSSFYHSEAWGIKDQDSFVNSVIEVAFSGTPIELLAICLEVEKELGRKRVIKWGPRLIDIDIIDFHREEWNSEELVLPHPFYSQRSFVLVPLAELEPDWTIAESNSHIHEYVSAFSDQERCIRLESI